MILSGLFLVDCTRCRNLLHLLVVAATLGILRLVDALRSLHLLSRGVLHCLSPGPKFSLLRPSIFGSMPPLMQYDLT